MSKLFKLFGAGLRMSIYMLRLPFAVVNEYIILPATSLLNPLLLTFSKTSAWAATKSRFDGLKRMILERIRVLPEDEIIHHICQEAMALGSSPKVNEGDRLLIEGKRKEYAELVMPPDRFPTIYQHIPQDVERDVVQDGRMLNGTAPATALAGVGLTEDFVKKSFINARRTGWRVGAGALASGLLFAAFMSFSGGILTYKIVKGGPSQAELQALGDEKTGTPQRSRAAVVEKQEKQLSAQEITALVRDYEDVFSDEQAAALAAKVNIEDDSVERARKTKAVVSSVAQTGLMLLLLTVSALFAATSAGRLTFISLFRHRVYKAVDKSVEIYRHSGREALQLWRARLDSRELSYKAYCRQVYFASNFCMIPAIKIGVSQGVMEFRRHLDAPPANTQIEVSIVDLMQHVSVLGGSGEGKSRDFYLPVMQQLLQLRADGYPIAFYCTDDKCAIGQDVVRMAHEIGIPQEDILVIGTGPNEYRVDVLDGVTPIELMNMLASIAKQGGNESADPFWSNMASDLILQVATMCRAAERTLQGEAWMKKNNIRMYSLLNILDVCTSDTEIEKLVKIVSAALRDEDSQYGAIQTFDDTGLHAALTYVLDYWLPMVDATKDGIRANVRNSLRAFAFHPELTRGFADGVSDRLIPASQLLSNTVKIINISQTKYGSAARLIAIMLKTMFFKQARAEEQVNPESAKARQNWWFNPRIEPGNAKYVHHFFVADEYQTLLTASDDGLSDTSVWNTLRSAGVSGILLSQGAAAYRLAVGQKAYENISQNWRSRIYLRTEDVGTLDEITKLVGKTTRYVSTEWDHFEGLVAARRELGVDPRETPTIEWDGSKDGQKVGLGVLGGLGEFEFNNYHNLFAEDRRFILPFWSTRGCPGVSADSNRDAVIGSEQASAWRREDKTRETMLHASSSEDAWTASDHMSMGRGCALAIVQRAGRTVIDCVQLNASA